MDAFFCSACGAPLSADVRFCGGCGAAVAGAPAPAAGAPPAPVPAVPPGATPAPVPPEPAGGGFWTCRRLLWTGVALWLGIGLCVFVYTEYRDRQDDRRAAAIEEALAPLAGAWTLRSGKLTEFLGDRKSYTGVMRDNSSAFLPGQPKKTLHLDSPVPDAPAFVFDGCEGGTLRGGYMDQRGDLRTGTCTATVSSDRRELTIVLTGDVADTVVLRRE